MRILGIDYGKKRVGVALTDSARGFALPHSVLQNDDKLFENIERICEDNDVREIVIGESKDFGGAPNKIMKDVSDFKAKVEDRLKLPVYLEPEFMTSKEAAHIQGENKMLDASAAALILKSYLDKTHNKQQTTNNSQRENHRV